MRKTIPRMHINTTISVELKNKADEFGIKFSEALRVGIAVMLADEGESQYVNTINIYRKFADMQQRLADAGSMLEQLRGR